LKKKILLKKQLKKLNKTVSGYGHLKKMTINNVAGKLFGSNTPVNRQTVPLEFKVNDVKAIIRSMLIKRFNRIKFIEPAKSFNDRVCHVFRHLEDYARHLPDSGYSMGEYKRIIVGKTFVSYYNNTSEYAKSSKYKAKHGYTNAHLTFKDARQLQIIGGLITIVGELVGNGLRKAEWFEKGVKYSETPSRITGYIAGDYHFTAPNIKAAKQKAKEYYDNKRQQVLKLKADEKKKKLIAAALQRKDKVTWVSLEDSIKAGNCMAGTKNFCNIARFDTETYGAMRADAILKLAEKNNVIPFANKAINQAKLRYAGIN